MGNMSAITTIDQSISNADHGGEVDRLMILLKVVGAHVSVAAISVQASDAPGGRFLAGVKVLAMLLPTRSVSTTSS